MNDFLDEFASEMLAHGYTAPTTLIADGGKHRFSVIAGKPSNQDGEYKIYEDFPPSGYFLNYKTGECVRVTSKRTTPLTPQEKESIRLSQINRAQREQRKFEDGVTRANAIWNVTTQIDTHPYLTKKQIKAHGARLYKDRLVIPVYSSDKLSMPVKDTPRYIQSLQFIDNESGKKFLGGAVMKGGYYVIGEPTDTICFPEGFATAASIHEATGFMTVVCFSCSALQEISLAFREIYPNAKFLICGDNGDVGIKAAKSAAKACRGEVRMPRDDVSDFNDLAVADGLESVKSILDSQDEDDIELLTLSKVKGKKLEFIKYPNLIAGKLHIIAGDGGTGKSQITLGWAAALSKSGGVWDDGSINQEYANTLIWTCEDDPEDTVKPRVSVLNADMDKIHLINTIKKDNKPRRFDPSTDIAALEIRAKKLGNVKLIILDPLINVCKNDTYKAKDVRMDLQPVVDLAQRLKCVVVGIAHFNKGTGGTLRDKISGSRAFTDFARVAMVSVKLKDHPEKLYATGTIKANNIGSGNARYYTIQTAHAHENDEAIETSRIQWGEEADCDIETLAQRYLSNQERPQTKKANAKEIIMNELSSGAKSWEDLLLACELNELTEGTARNAREWLKDNLKIKHISVGFPAKHLWVLAVLQENYPISKTSKTSKTSNSLANSSIYIGQYSDREKDINHDSVDKNKLANSASSLASLASEKKGSNTAQDCEKDQNVDQNQEVHPLNRTIDASFFNQPCDSYEDLITQVKTDTDSIN